MVVMMVVAFVKIVVTTLKESTVINAKIDSIDPTESTGTKQMFVNVSKIHGFLQSWSLIYLPFDSL